VFFQRGTGVHPLDLSVLTEHNPDDLFAQIYSLGLLFADRTAM
jgi:hypothetical protein